MSTYRPKRLEKPSATSLDSPTTVKKMTKRSCHPSVRIKKHIQLQKHLMKVHQAKMIRELEVMRSVIPDELKASHDKLQNDINYLNTLLSN